ncbi:molybdate ABC transporter substrate-binding protein [Microbacterium sp. B2969]|uniref:Molybdate ABC transporter substrate-binding protein n=1 Tax=Microbacterium alkaliflavum TaxID=3248839 RepID=A0ABW7Q2X7_9MICO
MKRIASVLALASIAVLGGCASQPSAAPEATASTPAADDLTGQLTIYAAASLKTAFDELATEFEAQHPGVDVVPIVYDGSSTLATQLIEGAPADVFASADEANMQKVVDAGLASGPELFATNTLVIATPKGNPGDVEDLSDLADDSVTVVLCAPEVPCGAASQKLISNAGLTVTPASYEQNVTAVLTKVAAGEADAGLVYVTDVKGRDDVDSIVPEGASDVVNKYPIVALKDAANPDAAAAFAEFLLGTQGQEVLAGLGFGAP